MASNPTVSVVMAAYNEEDYISEAIQSILHQSFDDFEFLIVDDCSTDETGSIIERFAMDDNRIKLLTNDSNQGLSTSLNRGIAEARGQYIARMDADDRSLPERFATQVRFLEANLHTHVVGCYARYIDPHGETLGTWECTVDRKAPETRKQDGPDVAHASVMMRRASVQAVGNYREAFTRAEDTDLWVRMAREFGPSFTSVVPCVLFEYRLTPDLFGRRQIDRIYGSYAGDLVGEEDKLRNRIAARLEQEDTTLQPVRQQSMYHFRVGQLHHGQNNTIPSLAHFLKSAWNDPSFATTKGLYRLWNRRE